MLSEIDQFVNWVHRRNPTARTWKDYGYDLRQFAKEVGDLAPSAVTFHNVDRFVNQQVSRGFQPTTINRRLATLVSFFTFLSEEDPTLLCPVLPKRHFLRERERLPRPVHPDHLQAFFAAVDRAVHAGVPHAIRDRAMFILMLRCGLRIGEVANVCLANLYLDEPRPRLVVHGKGSRERVVYLSPQAMRALLRYLAVRPDTLSDHIFLAYHRDGMSTTAIHMRLLHYRCQAEVSLTAHRLRHSFANDLLSADVPITTIQKLLGHRWLETTQIYVQANDKQVAADYYTACEKLEDWDVPSRSEGGW
jgi:site-specific recombinase XerD